VASVRSFRELRVYQEAFAAAQEIFELTKRFPPEEKYSLTSQIRKASRSVCANIAEGWRKRRYPAAFVSKLSDADAEAAEVRVWLDFSLTCEYIGEQPFGRLDASYNRIGGSLRRMMDHPEQWQPKPKDPSSLHSPPSSIHPSCSARSTRR